MNGMQVEAKMQELKAKQQSPFTLDKAWLSQQRPALLLTQDACRACDVDSSLVAQVPSFTTCTTLQRHYACMHARTYTFTC